MEPKKYFAFAALFFALMNPGAFAQEGNGCASDEINDNLLLTDPRFARSFMYFEQAVQQQLALNPSDRVDDIYTLPVVVHVIHEGEPVGTGSNISDAQIYSAIEAVNNDFRKAAGTNGDGDGVDTGIQFCLAARDPNGNSTNGIVRIDGSSVPNYAEQGIEATGGLGADEATVKALSTWPREDYVNIWIVNEIEDNNAGSGIQGFAYFPVDSPLDGIVILHNAFGTVGNLKASTSLNRTFTHEAGHYLALYHTFHSTTTCTAEANCLTAGDRVCDTPVTPLQTSCNSPACSGTQQVENYMDYTSESCRNMFTEGQKVRARTTLQTDRASILESLGCMPVTANDCGITNIGSPSGSTCDTFLSPSVFITNFGSNTITTCTIHYNIDGVGNSTMNWTGNLASASSVAVTLPGISASLGSHQFFAWTTNPNGVSDDNSTNDQTSSSFIVSAGGIATLTVVLDYFGSETTWEISDTGSVLLEGGPYSNNAQGTIINENLCLTEGCYTLTFFDSYGDGQGFTQGSFTLTNAEDSVLVFESGNWGEEVSNDFCLDPFIPEGVAPTASFAISDNLICKNSDADYTDSSSNSPTSWNWTFEGGTPSTSTQQHPQNIAYTTAGTYDITLTASNAFGSNTYTCTNCITVSAGPSVVVTKTDVTCYNANNGTATASASGGNSPYNYSWSSGQTSATISSLAPGSYTATVTDAQGCIKSQSTTISQPTAVAVNANVVGASCYGSVDGQISVTGSGGTPPYSYAWNTGATGNLITSLSPGNYTVTATDNANCQKQQTYSITQPGLLVANLLDFDIACTATSGAAQVSPSGGTAPYLVSWSNGATGNSVNNLSVGNYSAVVTDAHDCSVMSAFEIIQSENLTVNLDTDPISCNGANDATASVVVSGGNGSYTYNWSNGITGPGISNVGPGTYSVTVSDAEGCSGTASITFANPPALSLAVFKTDISCYGMQNGTASATASGGNGSYVYSWSNGATTAVVSGLSQGTYMITVHDANNCMDSELIAIVEPSQLTASCNLIQPETCSGEDGEAVVNVLGGTPGYSYSWSNGAQGIMISNVSSGNYNVSVTDGNNCATSTSIEIPYDCDIEIPVIQLVDTDCDQVGFALTDVVYCDEVPDAEMYRWRFANGASGEILTEEYSLSPAFLLSAVTGLGYGMTAFVEVKVMLQGAWGEYGAPCSITMEEELPSTGLVSEDCGAEGVAVGEVITAQPVAGATSYEWHITGEDYDFTTYSITNQLTLSAAMQFQEMETYTIQVRCLVEGNWTDFGPECTVTFGVFNSVDDEVSNGNLGIYPNPCDGETIMFDFGNILIGTAVKDLTIFGSTGKLIEEIHLPTSLTKGMKTTYKFKHPLPTGMYLIRYTLNGLPSEEKLLVR